MISLSAYLSDVGTPDVESLQLPFRTCSLIFLQLPLRDLHNCMLVSSPHELDANCPKSSTKKSELLDVSNCLVQRFTA